MQPREYGRVSVSKSLPDCWAIYRLGLSTVTAVVGSLVPIRGIELMTARIGY